MKPTIPRNIAAAIETVRKAGANNTYILQASIGAAYASSSCQHRRALADFADTMTDILAAALINGFEVEKTPEEAAHDRIRGEYKRRVRRQDYDLAVGIRWTLNELGVKITEVNA